MTKNLSKKEKEKRIIFLAKCDIVLMAISSTFMLYYGYHAEIADISNKSLFERKCIVFLIANWILIIIYFYLGRSIENFKKKLG